MKFVNDGEVDDKIIRLLADDCDNGGAYNTLRNLPKQLIKQIEFHFNYYKGLKKLGTAEAKVFESLDFIKSVVKASIGRFNKR